jgi:site-specific recombinase XerD
MSMAALRIRDALALYADHNEAEGKSPATNDWYRRRLGVFATWMEARGTPAVGDISVPVVELFTVQLRRKTTKFENNPFTPTREGSLSSHTVNSYVRALRAFSTWLHQAGYFEENVLASVKPPRTHKAVVDTLTDAEIDKLIGSIDRSSAIGVRDYALIVTYLDTGARCGELLDLRMEDVHLDEGWLLLDGKGNKERSVRLGATAKAALRLWERQARPAMAMESCPYLFVDARVGGKLSVGAVEQRIEQIGKKALPGRRVYCHLFRHTFSTNYLVYCLGDELHLMATLGHTTLLMVRHYVDQARFVRALRERQGSVMDTLTGSRPRGRPSKAGMTLWANRRVS